MILEWSIVSKVDMRSASDHIKKENPKAARQEMRKITLFAEGLPSMPRKGTRWKMQKTYKMPIPNTKFSMIWKVYKDQDKVKVLRVMHQSRQLPELLDDDGYNFGYLL